MPPKVCLDIGAAQADGLCFDQYLSWTRIRHGDLAVSDPPEFNKFRYFHFRDGLTFRIWLPHTVK